MRASASTDEAIHLNVMTAVRTLDTTQHLNPVSIIHSRNYIRSEMRRIISQLSDPVTKISQLINIEVSHHPPGLRVITLLPLSRLSQTVHSRPYQQRLQATILTKQDISVGPAIATSIVGVLLQMLPVSDHESPLRDNARMTLLDYLKHELAGLAKHYGSPACRSGYCRHHGPSTWE